MSCILRSIRVTFTREGVEYAVTYAHDGEAPTAGTKERTSTAARMARTRLEAALEALGSGPARISGDIWSCGCARSFAKGGKGWR